ncbi:hypothetical protein HN51_038249 [Arachis hypogaea]|nr:transcription factor bHLH91 isoform X2 [Arachis ipaensis]XP_025639843.1 transcription factor bHLH91-like isoform X2 [Arachis hypogaea]XP_025691457.1 transcription factor bHLH91 isoform X2 [Arachis hypogaea]QHO03938.1 Transcription factor [Arachis hypogaea]RYR64220.1 hypothetical protein Ahy_A03g010352 [Arachis hypogaea]
MSCGDRPNMHEQPGCFDPNTMAEGVSTPKLKDTFPQTLSDPSSSPSPLIVVGNTTNSNNNLEENIRLSMEELSYHHQQEDVSNYVNGVTATTIDIPHPQHLGLNMGNSYNNNINMDSHLVQHEIDILPYQQPTWDPNVQEMQDMGYTNHSEHQPHDQQFQQTEAQNCSQSYNPSSILDPPYPSQDLLNLLHLPRCSTSSLLANPAICIANKTQNFQNPMGFLGDLPIGSDNTSASSVLYDPLLHLNLPPQPPALRELFQSLPRGYSLPTNSRSGSLFGGGDEIEGDGSQLDMGVLDFNRVTASVGKGREGKGTKHFATEKQRREQLNGKYKILRSLIPSPTKMDRASVVGDAIEYIRELLRTVNELKLLVEKKRYGRERCKRQKAEDDAAESCNIKPFSDPDGCIRTSWLQRKSKDSEVDVRIVDDDVTIKLFQRKKINCLLSVAKVLDELQLELHHVAGGHVGEYCSFLFNSKIIEGSSVYASAIANRVIDVMDTQYAAAVPHTSSY